MNETARRGFATAAAVVALAIGVVLVGAGAILESSGSSALKGTPGDVAILVVFVGMALAATGLMSAGRSPHPERSLLLTGSSLIVYALAYALTLGLAEG